MEFYFLRIIIINYDFRTILMTQRDYQYCYYICIILILLYLKLLKNKMDKIKYILVDLLYIKLKINRLNI